MISGLNIDAAILRQHELHFRSKGIPSIGVAEFNIRRTIRVQVVLAGEPRAHLPFDTAVDLDVQQHRPDVQVLLQSHHQSRRDRHGSTVQERRPHRVVLVALVGGGQHSGERDLLASVGGVDVELQVVDSDAVHAVFGGDGYLHGGGEGEGRGGGDVEGEDGGVPEDERGFGGAEDYPDEEDDEQDEDDEGGDAVEYVAVELLTPLVVVAAVLGSHVLERRRGLRRVAWVADKEVRK